MNALLLASLLFPGAAPPVDFALRDGDTVVFLGDSITAARTYGKYLENYTLLRFPQRRVRFVNAGWGGDTMAGGLRRLERDVFVHRPTVVTVAYGVNDIGWGFHADEVHKRTYLDSLAALVDACIKRGIRVYICSAAITAADPDRAEKDFLQTMCDEGLALGRARGAYAIDVQRSMRAVQRRVLAWNARHGSKETMHAADGVHLNDLGQLAMAAAILEGWNAPSEVSSVRIDGRAGTFLEARGCRVRRVRRDGAEVSFVREDRGLPFNHGIFFALHFRFVPMPDTLNRYLLAVTNLPSGNWEVHADGRLVGTFTAALLARGVNLASSTGNAWEPGGPWNAQADVLKSLTDARHELLVARMQAGQWFSGRELASRLGQDVVAANERLEAMQRQVAKPRPYHFVLKRAAAKPERKKGS